MRINARNHKKNGKWFPRPYHLTKATLQPCVKSYVGQLTLLFGDGKKEHVYKQYRWCRNCFVMMKHASVLMFTIKQWLYLPDLIWPNSVLWGGGCLCNLGVVSQTLAISSILATYLNSSNWHCCSVLLPYTEWRRQM